MNTRTETIIDKADSYIDSKLPQSPEAIKKRRNRILKPAAVIALGATFFTGYNIAKEATSEPTFSEQTVSYVVEPGDGLQRAAEGVEGYKTVDIRDVQQHIQDLPQNEDALEDGLQPGEILDIPASVKP